MSHHSSCILGSSFKKRLDLRVIDSRPVRKETLLNSEFGIFSGLHMEDLQSVAELSRPDFVSHPHLYFNRKQESSPILPEKTHTQAVKAVFDEHSLFPKELLDLRDGLSHGDLRNNREERKECRERKTGKGRSRKDRNPKGSVSGTPFK
ncbi:WD repeat-containing protein 49-like [Hypomesus transpacificus]|uniref:WD repeat-containing protein 49-like n=1 Tax=Hypomesus transpacificus TaxID=137520 RepID=UPI001F07F56A|nr:WD repeat-containing protein 49-like [Hypomesus transpacificus]